MCAAQDVDVLSRSGSSRPGRPLLAALAVAALVLLIDQVTKAWAVSRLVAGPCSPDGPECIDLVAGLRFHLVFNEGAAFSTGTGLGPLIGVIATILTVVLLNMARLRTDRAGPILLGAVAGGALGNVVDRVARADDGPLSGGVVDFIDAQWWPVFNVADAAVVVGIICFVGLSLFLERQDEPVEGEHDVADGDPAAGDAGAGGGPGDGVYAE